MNTNMDNTENNKNETVAQQGSDTNKLAYHSDSWDALLKFPIVNKIVSRVKGYPIVTRTLTTVKDKTVSIVESPRQPALVQKYTTKIVSGINKADTLFAILVFEKGINSFLEEWSKHTDRKLGIWIVLFFIDYVANIFNYLLKELILRPLNLLNNNSNNNSARGNIEDHKKNDSNSGYVKKAGGYESLPHVNELTSTTMNLSKDLQTKVNSDLINPTKENVKKQFDSYIKPTVDTYVKPNVDAYVKPTVDNAKIAYQTVSSTYEENLNKSEQNIPRALYTTGVEIGNQTFEKINSNFHSSSKNNNTPPVTASAGSN